MTHRLLSRVWWLPVFAVTAATAALTVGADTGDLPFFVHAADDLFSREWSRAYANPDLQIGPVQVVLLAIAGALPFSTLTVLAVAVPLGVTALFLVVVRQMLGERRPLALMLVGVAFAGLGLPAAAYTDGHMAQAVVPLLWVLAGLQARNGHALTAGGLVALSAGFELWGLLGVVVLLVAPGVREAAAGVAIAVAGIGLLFAPFALFGDVRMFDYHWVVNGDTLLSLVVDPGTDFTWWMRLVQGGAAVGVGAALAWPLRRTMHAVWLAPLAVVAVRLALDPVRYPWYWLALQTLVVAGVAEFAAGKRFRRHHRAQIRAH